MIVLTFGSVVAMHYCMADTAKNKGAALMGAWAAETSQAQIAEQIGRSQSQVSRYISGESVPEFLARRAAWRVRGIPLDAWDLPSEDANSASHIETPQAARTSSIPPSRQPLDAAASEGCPAPSEAA
jgi:DNA-binding phage protein